VVARALAIFVLVCSPAPAFMAMQAGNLANSLDEEAEGEDAGEEPGHARFGGNPPRHRQARARSAGRARRLNHVTPAPALRVACPYHLEMGALPRLWRPPDVRSAPDMV